MSDFGEPKRGAPPTAAPSQPVSPARAALGLAGAAAGGVVGFCAFGWLLTQGFYAMLLPGVLVGLGCRLASRARSWWLGGVCGVLALALGLLCEWWFRAFTADGSLGYFLTHLGEIESPVVTLGLTAGGGVLACYFGRGS